MQLAQISDLAILWMKPSSTNLMCNEKPSEVIPGVLSKEKIIEHKGSNRSGEWVVLIADYTKWHQKYFDNVSSDDFQAAAVDYAKNNPL